MEFTYSKSGYEILKEQQEENYINESMYFSKKDLENPDMMEKILKRKGTFDSVTKFLNWLITALGIALDILLFVKVGVGAGIGGGFGIIVLFTYIESSISSIPYKDYEKNVDKYKNKLSKYKKDIETALEKESNPKKIEKLKETKKKIDNVYKQMEEKEKQRIKDAIISATDALVKIIPKLVNWWEEPITKKPNYYQEPPFGHTGQTQDENIFQWLIKLKVPQQKVIDHVIQYALKKEYYWDRESFIKVTIGDPEDDVYDIIKDTAFKGDKFIFFSSDDESVTFINITNKKFYYTDGESVKIEDMYKYFLPNEDRCPNESFIEADKQLGYYMFSKCPDQVKKKEFPIKF